jgi:hypothetical protein
MYAPALTKGLLISILEVFAIQRVCLTVQPKWFHSTYRRYSMNTFKAGALVAFLVLLLSLAACGGGGSSGNPSDQPKVSLPAEN